MRRPATKRKARRGAKPSQAARRVLRSIARMNPDPTAAEAAELFELFHGEPSTRTRAVTLRADVPTDLADLGKLVELVVWLDEDYVTELHPKGNVRVGCVPETDPET